MTSTNPACPTRFPKAKRAFAATLCIAAGFGCVTVNVNFPEGVVQRATDDFVRDLYRAKTTETPAAPSPKTSGEKKSETTDASGFLHWLKDNLLIADAHADEAFRVNTAGALDLQKRLRGRLAEVLKFKRMGYLGEDNGGQLVIRPEGQKKAILAGKLNSLVVDENKDRSALYGEVLKANSLGDDKTDMIRRSFANSFQAESPSGTWVQSAEGSWDRKP